MANNAEAVGRLLAINTLMKGERELLRKPEEPPAQEAAKSSPQQPSSSPISHDSKAVEAVLLKLLDERLQASDAEAMNWANSSSDLRRTAADDAANSPRRITARYADDGLAANGEALRSETTFQFGQGQLRGAALNVPPELQFFIQGLAARAAGTSDIGATTIFNGGPDRASSQAPGGFAGIRIAMIAIALLGLGVLISQLLTG